MPKLTVRWSLLLLSAVNLTSCAAGERSEVPQATVRVAYAPVVLNLPLFLALDRGWFVDANVQVHPISFTTANDMINALIAGQVDVVTGVSLVPVTNLEAEGPGRIRVITHSRMDAAHPYDGIVVRRESPVRRLSDLAGRKVAVYPGTTAANLLKAFLGGEGISVDSVELVALPPSSHISALQTGAVDALFAYEPTLTMALHSGARLLHGSVFVSLLDPSPISGSVIARAFERANPGEASAFIAVLDRAILAIRRAPDSARTSLLGHTSLSDSLIGAVNLVPDVTSAETDSINLQAFVELLQRLGEVRGRVTAARLLAPTR